MNYTILLTEDIQGDIKLNLDKDGNQYLVGLYQTTTKKYHYRFFKTMDEAMGCYQMLIDLIGRHYGTFQNKVDSLFNY